MQPLLKICGITNTNDACIAAGLGADFLGIIVEIPQSPRSVSVEEAQEIQRCTSLPVVLLSAKPCAFMKSLALRLKPHALQLVDDYSLEDISRLKKESPSQVWKVLRIPKADGDGSSGGKSADTVAGLCSAGVDAIVLDTLVAGKKGGTGQTCDWTSARRLAACCPVPVFLAGGITPDNVAEAIISVRPDGIDISSGVEKKPGRKDPEKITRLIQAMNTAVAPGHR